MPGNHAAGDRLRSSSMADQQAAGPRLREENPFKVHLRIQGIPQAAVLEDQGRQPKIQELVDTLRSEYQTESVVADLRREKEDSTGSVKNQNVEFKA